MKPAEVLYSKQIVFTLVQRGGEARAFHVANVTAKTLRPVVGERA